MAQPTNFDHIIAPTNHFNGTSAAVLLTEYEKAHDCLMLAIKTLEAVTVHGRDYYPQDESQTMQGSTYRTARDQHVRRLNKLLDVAKELDVIRNKIIDQM